ncbi:MAG: hypothetical protein ABIK20_01735 [Candidatus Omnitrophota bacterium]|nr:hypothetical protein [Candidatus Omnitrophota bacterium]
MNYEIEQLKKGIAKKLKEEKFGSIGIIYVLVSPPLVIFLLISLDFHRG